MNRLVKDLKVFRPAHNNPVCAYEVQLDSKARGGSIPPSIDLGFLFGVTRGVHAAEAMGTDREGQSVFGLYHD